MILDLERFAAEERPYWQELETILDHLAEEPMAEMDMERVNRFYYLYQRASADLVKIETFAAEPELKRYLETLVSRAYGEIHESRQKTRLKPIAWFTLGFPRVFRKQFNAFKLAVLVTVVGMLFGGAVIRFDPASKAVIMPFSHLLGDPSDRVAQEEAAKEDRLSGSKSTFSTYLMTHNTRVSIITFVLGMTWGIGTLILLFYNGVILGSVVVDYVQAGESVFLMGWLMPHGVIEIPAILIAGQAGFVLAAALIGWGDRHGFKARMRLASKDLTILIGGVAVMLVWAGLIEAFLSQYHEPAIPYWLKIGFGCLELAGLVLFLGLAGRKTEDTAQRPTGGPAPATV